MMLDSLWIRRGASALAVCLAVLAAPSAATAQRQKPPIPDLTAGGTSDGKHDWNLGPTGLRGWMWGWKLETTDARQILITEVADNSPAAGLFGVGDVILGIGEQPFAGDPRRALGAAITAAEAGDGVLRLLRWRAGARAVVDLRLPTLGGYAATAPWDCAKSEAILAAACEHIAGHMKGDIDGMINALALLATGEAKYVPAVRKLALQVAPRNLKLTLKGRTSGLFSWQWGYRALFLCEYHLATKDPAVLPAIREYATTLAEGQSGVGTWGHGMAWPDLNDGKLHGRLGGYGAVNQAGLINHLALVLATKCGVTNDEIRAAIERANKFARFYVGKGAIPYGDHDPGNEVHDDNGKDSVVAILFDLQGLHDEARFFAKMTVASYGERERGHTGNYFSFLWGPLGAARAGDAAAAAFLAEQRWYYDLARGHDGSFGYQGGAGMDGGEHQYGDWDCTGAFVLASALPRRKLMITGRDDAPLPPLVGEELAETIEAGRGFDSWSKASEYYQTLSAERLLELLRSWSPAVRSRAAAALAKKDGDFVPTLVARLREASLDVRYGACQGLGALGPKAAAAVPALVETLGAKDVWLRIQAAYALADLGEAARAAAPAMLQLALQSDPDDPREFTQRYLAFCIFYPGGALGMRGVFAKSVGDIDRDLLRRAVVRLLQNDDGRARSAVGNVYKLLTLDELAPILPEIVAAIRTPSPSGEMFADGIRLQGLELLAKHRIAEGMQLCLDILGLDRWGQKDRIKKCLEVLSRYGGAAKPLLPQLRELEGKLAAQKALAECRAQCAALIAAIEAAPVDDGLRSLDAVVGKRGATEPVKRSKR